MADWLLDAAIVPALLWLAWRTLSADELLTSAVLFISLGFVMALAWVRLGAPDVALAEAALGAGLTGALVLDAAGHLQPSRKYASDCKFSRSAERWRAGGAVSAAFALAWSARDLAERETSLTGAVEAEIERSGVSHPVTAVLLNFRSYDTLLEVAALVVAVLGAWSIGGAPALRSAPPAVSRGITPPVETSPILIALTRFGAPVAVLVAGYVLWAGAHRPGGAFQAAAILAGAGVLLLLPPLVPSPQPGCWLWRFLATAGLLVFLAVGAFAAAAGRNFLEYPQSGATALILLIESALTVSLAVILVLLFVAASSTGSADRGGKEATS